MKPQPIIAAGIVLPPHAMVRGAARIMVQSDLLVLGPGPSGLYTTAHRDDQLGVRVTRGCYSGTLAGYAALIDTAQLSEESRVVARMWVDLIAGHFSIDRACPLS